MLRNDDGVIFISIDDSEVDNLRKLCNEIFGESHFVAQIVVQSNKGGQDYLPIAKTHEYVLCYAKGEDADEGLFELEREPSGLSFEDTRGRYEPRELRNRNPRFHRGNRPNLFYPLYVNPELTDGNGYSAVALERQPGYVIEAFPRNSEGADSCWRWGKPKVQAHLASDQPILSDVVARQTRSGGWNIYEKSRRATQKAKTLWDETEVRTEAGTREVREIFGEAVYDHPKPTALVRKVIQIGSNVNDLVLDFFAGSGTTAHSVLKLNRHVNGNRKFILVQLPEPTGRTDLPTIAEITKERVRRVITTLNAEDGGKVGGAVRPDRGFRVLKLAESNFRTWNANVAHEVGAVTQQLEMHVGHVREERTDDDIVTEILLKSGFPPTSYVDRVTIMGTNMSSVAQGALLICLDRHLTLEVIRAMAEQKPERVVCLDEGFAENDQLKANAAQIFKTKAIVFRTV